VLALAIMRKTVFANGEFYHVYNRGTDKRIVFANNYDFQRFLQSMEEFNSVDPIGSIYQNSFCEPQLRRPTSKLVNIVCYCLNPKRLGGGYTKHFNFKHKRSGVLFQGKFKANHIDSNEYLLHASAYVNLNGLAHKLKNNQFYSSWEEFVNKNSKGACKKDIILDQFKDVNEYRMFVQGALKKILARKELLKEMEDLFALEN